MKTAIQNFHLFILIFLLLFSWEPLAQSNSFARTPNNQGDTVVSFPSPYDTPRSTYRADHRKFCDDDCNQGGHRNESCDFSNAARFIKTSAIGKWDPTALTPGEKKAYNGYTIVKAGGFETSGTVMGANCDFVLTTAHSFIKTDDKYKNSGKQYQAYRNNTPFIIPNGDYAGYKQNSDNSVYFSALHHGYKSYLEQPLDIQKIEGSDANWDWAIGRLEEPVTTGCTTTKKEHIAKLPETGCKIGMKLKFIANQEKPGGDEEGFTPKSNKGWCHVRAPGQSDIQFVNRTKIRGNDLCMTDCDAVGGSSGGALYDEYGKLAAIVTSGRAPAESSEEDPPEFNSESNYTVIKLIRGELKDALLAEFEESESRQDERENI